MSFILDALKKSENERQRQSGPGLFEVKVAAPKARWPGWAFALAALLAINIGVVGWLMLRQPSRAAVAARAPAQAAIPATQTPPALAMPSATPPVAPAPPAQMAPAPSPTAEASTEELNPEDYAPAVEPYAPASTPQGHATRGTAEGLPTYEQIAGTAGSGVPELRLDLHVYATKPQDRFILLNMHRLREGDSLPEGVRVDQITPTGALLSFRAAKFVLERD